jgi:hypothetical protein
MLTRLLVIVGVSFIVTLLNVAGRARLDRPLQLVLLLSLHLLVKDVPVDCGGEGLLELSAVVPARLLEFSQVLVVVGF